MADSIFLKMRSALMWTEEKCGPTRSQFRFRWGGWFVVVWIKQEGGNITEEGNII